jgi:iron complex transport system substrate-binding protein
MTYGVWQDREAMYPERIVCLTEETTETLYLLGEERRIVGISGFTVRPARARKEKPRVSDQRSIAEIFQMMAVLGGMVGCQARAEALIARIQADLQALRARALNLRRRPRVYFEEWDEPQISAIRWVSELLELAGGIDCFPELALQSLGRNRIIADPLEVPRRAPDIIFGSWCGKKFQPAAVAARPGWGEIPAVRAAQLHEIKAPIILQPGPAALTDGVQALHAAIAAWAARY